MKRRGMAADTLTLVVTGGFCSGKSLVVGRLAQRGAACIDCDRIVHERLYRRAGVLARVSEILGFPVALANGGVDRRRMARAVFENSRKRANLEAYLHPLVFSEIDADRRRILRQSHPPALLVVEVPLLAETGAAFECDAVALVACAPRFQLRRARERGYGEQQARKILACQTSWRRKTALADYILYNNASAARLAAQADALYEALTCRPGLRKRSGPGSGAIREVPASAVPSGPRRKHGNPKGR